MRRRFPVCLRVVLTTACLVLALSPAAGAQDLLYQGVSDLVFHLTTYDETSKVLQRGQGLVIGPGGTAIVSATALKGASRAVATLIDGSAVSVREVYSVDEVSGLAKVSLKPETPASVERIPEKRTPQPGEEIIFSDLASRGRQICVESVIASTRTVPGIEGLYYLETSRTLPRPGGGIFDSDGRLVGVVVKRFGNGRSGLLASNDRLSILAGQKGRKVALKRWADRKIVAWDDTTHARYVKGQVAFWKGRPETTLDLLEDSANALPHLEANVSALLGEAYLAMDLLPEAILAFKNALENGSGTSSTYQKLAWAYMETGQIAQAEKMCHEAILKDPDSPAGYTLLAHLRNLQGDYKHGVYEARRALMRDPGYSCAYFERGRGYIGLARYKSAIEALKNATTIDPEYGEAFISLGYAYIRSSKPLKAIVVLKEAVKIRPEMAEGWANLGEAYSMAGLSDKALDALRQAVCLTQSDSYGYCRLAKELMKQGSYKEAAAVIRQGIAQCEESQWLTYYLGKVFYMEGRIVPAREQAELLRKENSLLGEQLLRIFNRSLAEVKGP